MNVPQVLINAVGPVPLSASFFCAGSTQVFLVSGSAWTTAQPRPIGVNILLDGNNVGVSRIWANDNNSHKATVTQRVIAHLTPGSHTIGLTVLDNNTITDFNDYFNVLLFDLG